MTEEKLKIWENGLNIIRDKHSEFFYKSTIYKGNEITTYFSLVYNPNFGIIILDFPKLEPNIEQELRELFYRTFRTG